MAEVTRVHPTAIDTATVEYFIGRDNVNMLMFELDFGAAVNAKTGPVSTIARAIEAIAGECTILIKGDLHSTNQVMDFLVEHGNQTDTYDGSVSEAFAAHLEDVVQALATVDGINLASSSITAKTSFNLA